MGRLGASPAADAGPLLVAGDDLHAKGRSQRSATCDFVVTDSARRFRHPDGRRLVRRIAATPHHRLYVTRDGLQSFRTRSASNPEAREFLDRARKRIDMDPVPIAPTRPRDTTGMSPFQKSRSRLMYHKFGEVVTQPIVDFSLAWLLSGEDAFLDAVVRHARHVAAMPVDSDATSEDLQPLGHHVRTGLRLRYGVRPHDAGGACGGARSDPCAANVSSGIMSAILRVIRWTTTSGSTPSATFFFTSVATLGDLPEAERWLRYCYEVWCGRFPILGGDDGGWHDGSSYMQANLVTFVYVPFVLSRLTGTDFFDLPWYRNLPSFLVYLPERTLRHGLRRRLRKDDLPVAALHGLLPTPWRARPAAARRAGMPTN